MKRLLIWSIGTIAVMIALILSKQIKTEKAGLHPKLRYDLSTASGQMAYSFDKKVARRARAEVNTEKYDKPDLAMLLEVENRSEIGEPYSYEGSYRFRALREAKSSAKASLK